MSTGTILFLLAFGAMIAMHLRGHGGHGQGGHGQGGGHAGCGGGHAHSFHGGGHSAPHDQDPASREAASADRQHPEVAEAGTQHEHGTRM